jgi:hypothetical protein
MAERVLAQLLAEGVAAPVPSRPGRLERVRGWLRTHRRHLAAAFSGLLVVLVLTPPVRAVVAEWFDFGGVEVRHDPSASPRPGASVPGCGPRLSLAEAARRAGFAPRVPSGLGAPDAVSLTGAAGNRPVISLCWAGERGRVVRLDEFAAALDIYFAKQVQVMPQWVEMADGTGLWFGKSHLLRFAMTDSRGTKWTESVRTAGPTLLWQTPGTDTAEVPPGEALTLRLEGVAPLEDARAVAESLR